MFIKEIVVYDYNYAEYIVTDGEYELLCVCVFSPLSQKPQKGTMVNEIVALMVDGGNGVKRTELKTYLAERQNKKRLLEHTLRGKVIDKEKALIAIGELVVQLDPFDLSEDTMVNDFVEFKVDRLDCEIYN